jgi:F-type H+-transporting ATPase subunit a
MAEHAPDPFEHVMDSPASGDKWEFFNAAFGRPIEWHLPGFDINIGSFHHHFQLTKFMLLELVAAALILLIYIPLARRSQNGELPRGGWWNAFESLLTFIRNEVAKPNLGEKEADKYVPYLWTLFLFLLFCNLLGMIPFAGSPTASIWVTGALACLSFLMLHGAAIVKMGLEPADAHAHGHGHDQPEAPGHHLATGHEHPAHPASAEGLEKIPVLGVLLLGLGRYFKALWPHIDVPYVGWLFSLAIFVIEFISTFIKSGVLAVRLFANMFAGHTVLAVILGFILSAANSANLWLLGGVSVASVLGVVALSLLELFVAFLQAYIFVFLTALFMGMSLHPEH